MASSLKARYAAGVAGGLIEPDSAQLAVVDKLARLEVEIAEHRLARKSSSLGWMFGTREKKQPPIKGLYIYGAVGRGKTMLMDLFFEASPVLRKRRAHFHEFMLDVHERVHELRQKMKLGEYPGADPIELAAADVAVDIEALDSPLAFFAAAEHPSKRRGFPRQAMLGNLTFELDQLVDDGELGRVGLDQTARHAGAVSRLD
jgi:cell division protein ZapE